MRQLTLAALALLLALVPLPARAQDMAADPPADAKPAEPETPGPKPLDLMRAARAAMAGVKTLSYTAEVTGVGSQILRSPDLKAAVLAARSRQNDPLGWKFMVKGDGRLGAQDRPVHTVYDGMTARSIRAWEKKVVEGPGDNARDALADGSDMAAALVIRWKQLVDGPFADDVAPPQMGYVGKADIGGVTCDVVYVDYSESSDPNLFDIWWYLAESDHLPRRMDMHFVSNRIADGFSTIRITDLKTGVEFPESAVEASAPAEFILVKAKEPEQHPMGRAVDPLTLAVGEKAPDWELADPAGKRHRLSDYAGKVVVLDFWATWCGPCLQAMPGIQAIHEKFKGRPVAVFGLNCWESGDPAALMLEKSFTYGLLLKADGVAKDYGVSGIPTFYVVGKDGKIAHVAIGFDPEGEAKLEEVINNELAKPSPLKPKP
ncbi:MAG: TlpA disulfide reductase family protein [Phycisphaerales bacterium]